MTFILGLRASSTALRRRASASPHPLSHRAISSSARFQAVQPGTGNPQNVEDYPSSVDEINDYPPARPGPVPASGSTIPDASVSLLEGLSDSPQSTATDWSKSYHGLSSQPFSDTAAAILQARLSPEDIEMKPDGLLYLPEIKYRRVLNKAFGPGGWGLAPRSETNVGPKVVSREYALVALGRLVAVARGEQEYFDANGIPTATEGCKSNALMRCCKDIGIASELWDPRFIRQFKKEHCVEVFVEHLTTKRRRKLWRRKEDKFEYPYKET